MQTYFYIVGLLIASIFMLAVIGMAWEKRSDDLALRRLDQRPSAQGALALISYFVAKKNTAAVAKILAQQPDLLAALTPQYPAWVAALDAGSGAFGGDMGLGVDLMRCESELIKACAAHPKT